MPIPRTASGKVDKRTKEGKALCARLSAAQRARHRASSSSTKSSSSGARRTADGTLDKRTKAGKAACARMAAARAAKGSLKNRLKRLFS